MKKLFIILIILIGPSIKAQNIVYVDSRYILENIPEFNTAQEELSKLSSEWEEEIDLLKEEAETPIYVVGIPAAPGILVNKAV